MLFILSVHSYCDYIVNIIFSFKHSCWCTDHSGVRVVGCDQHRQAGHCVEDQPGRERSTTDKPAAACGECRLGPYGYCFRNKLVNIFQSAN